MHETKPEMSAMLLKMPASTHEAIRSIAAAAHRSMNAEVNVAIERHVLQSKEFHDLSDAVNP